jgi:hypothetical protein
VNLRSYSLSLVLLAAFACLFVTVPALAAAPAARLTVHILAAPTVFSEVDNHTCFEGKAPATEFDEAQPCDQYNVIVTNSGSQPANGPVVLRDHLPAGLHVGASELLLARNQVNIDEPEGSAGEQLGECETVEGKTGVKCEFTGQLQPDQRLELALRVRVELGAQSGAEDLVEVFQAGTKVAVSETADTLSPTDVAPPFGPAALLSLINGVDGSPDVQAGDHPYEFVSEFDMATGMGQGVETAVRYAHSAGGGVRDVVVELPPGFVGNAQAAAKCTLGQAQSVAQCPADSLVGHIDTEPGFSIEANSPVYNLVPEHGVAAELGFLDSLHGTHVVDVTLAPTPQGYVLRALAKEIPVLLLWDAITTVYGNPSAKNGGASPPSAMFTNPSDCSGEPLVSKVYLDSWQHPATFNPDGTPDVEGPGAEGWASTSSEAPSVTGCNQLHFNPSFFSFAPEPAHSQADEPSGYESVMRIPQSEDPATLATPPLKSAVVTLPPGVSISPSAADGLQACSASQFGFLGRNPANGIDQFTEGPAACPDASKIGTVEVVTPLLEEHLTGSVYVAQPGCAGEGCEQAAEEGGLFGIYLEIGSETNGLHVKLLGKVEVGGEGHHNDLAPGQLRTSFIRTPQAPFSELRFKFNGGPRAALANPQSCGTFTTGAQLEPWSAPQSGPSATEAPSFAISGGCGGGFAPSFVSDMANPQAGAYGALTTTFTRRGGEQDLAGATVTTPEGLLGKVAGITQCAEAQANAGTCPASSRIGTATAAAGSGSHPFYQSGPVYLTGPYKGGPFGLSIAVAAVAGPYNLGTIVTRASIHINPATAQATIVSDPLPQSVDGVPLRLQLVNVTVGEGGNFTFNATSCAEKSVVGTLTGSGGTSANVSNRYQAANCQGLPFHPILTASTQGKTSKANGASLSVKITAKPGEANIAKTDLTIPRILPSRLTTLQQACTEAQFDANPAGCPPASDIATAVVHTPLLNSPLVGPAYFVSHGGAAFPDIELVLEGEGVELVLDGHTQIKNGITYSRFESVPDAPFTTFEFNAPEGPYSVLTTEKPGQTNLCAVTTAKTVKKRIKLERNGNVVRRDGRVVRVTRKLTEHVPSTITIPTTIVAQNGAVVTQSTKVAVTGCPKQKAKAASMRHTGRDSGYGRRGR